MTAEAVLVAEELGFSYGGGLPVLDDISFSLEEGRFTVLLGPSGCGKSTLLRLVAGLEAVTVGRLSWRGNKTPCLGAVFQLATLMPWADAARNVALPLELQGIGKKEARAVALDALAKVGLAAAAATYPAELSGGMAMRVAIARALVTSPRFLVMDEPFAALDEITRFQLNDLVRSLTHEAGVTVLFVTHSVYEAAYLADRVLVMGQGPGTLQADIRNDLPVDRDGAVRGTRPYLDLCNQLSRALEQAMKVGA